MHKFMTLLAVAGLGVVWSVGPASAQTTTTEKAADKVEDAKEKAAEKVHKAEDKAEKKVEKAKDEAQRSADKAADKADGTKDTLKDKAVRAKDTVKDKVEQATDKMKAKMERANDRVSMTDARAAQEALKTQGFDPGPVDGRVGPRTKAAILDYQKKNDLPMTGMLDDATMARLNVRSSRTTDVPSASPMTQPDPKKQN